VGGRLQGGGQQALRIIQGAQAAAEFAGGPVTAAMLWKKTW